MHLHVRHDAARCTGLPVTADLLTLLYMHNEPFSALTLQAGLQEEHPACNTLVPIIPNVLFQNSWGKELMGPLANLESPGKIAIKTVFLPYGAAKTILGAMPGDCKTDPGCTWTFGCTYKQKHHMNLNKSTWKRQVNQQYLHTNIYCP